jgi:hypothetical protein
LGQISGIQIGNPTRPTINLFALAEQQAFRDRVLAQRQMWAYTGRITEIRHLSRVRSSKQRFGGSKMRRIVVLLVVLMVVLFLNFLRGSF